MLYFNTDGTGINMEEFRSMLIALKIFMDDELIPMAFRACNISHNGIISFEEFWQVCCYHSYNESTNKSVTLLVNSCPSIISSITSLT